MCALALAIVMWTAMVLGGIIGGWALTLFDPACSARVDMMPYSLATVAVGLGGLVALRIRTRSRR